MMKSFLTVIGFAMFAVFSIATVVDGIRNWKQEPKDKKLLED